MPAKPKVKPNPFGVVDEIGKIGKLQLQSSILIYRRPPANDGGVDNMAPVMATVNEIEYVNGKPTMMPGQCVTPSDVEGLLGRLLEANSGLQLFPPNLLAATLTACVWWVPPSTRRMWFQDRDKKLMKLDGEMFPQPGLVMFASQTGFSIFAVKGNSRPVASTKLWRAPYLNLFEQGNLCAGTARIPKDAGIASIPKYEDGFFNSRGVHSHVKLLVKYPWTHDKLWLSLHKKRRFPDGVLSRLDKSSTLGELIAGNRPKK
jgi:PRTRC genetic system protein B